MRIAMFSWESLHSIAVGGVAVHVTELAAAMERKGHEVHVFTRMVPGWRYHERIDGVHYHRCPYPSHSEFVDDVNNMCRAFVDRFFAIEDYIGRFDIVHAHDWLTANAMIWVKQGRGHRCILTFHSTEYGRCGNCFPNGRSVRVRDQERAGAYWADHIIAVSHAVKKELTWMYETPEWKISVVYNGVGPHRFDSDADPGQIKRQYQIGPVDPTVLFCGRLTHQKGPDLLLDAIPAILKYYPAAKFVFAGDGDMRGVLEARMRQQRLDYSVRFIGNRGGDELVRLYRMSDAVCVPSRNEPFGIVVLEAWSARKPVVVTQNGGPNEYVSHEVNGLKVYPTRDSIAWGLGTLFADFDRARRMGENGRSVVEASFTWDKIVEQALLAYEGHTVDTPQAAVAPEPSTPPTVPEAPQNRALEAAPENAGKDEPVTEQRPAAEEEGSGHRRQCRVRSWVPLSLPSLVSTPIVADGK